MPERVVQIMGLELKSLNKSLRGISRKAKYGAAASAREQRGQARLFCASVYGRPPSPPLVITITRIGPRELDSDNLAGSAKHIRDGIADWLQVNDRDKRLAWHYEQASEGRGVYGVRIRIQADAATTPTALRQAGIKGRSAPGTTSCPSET